MADVFVSYSRQDSGFVDRIVNSLEALEREVWVDVRGIEDAEVFPAAIRMAIERSNSFVYVITPASAGSAYCAQEVDYATDLNKRIIPVLRTPVPDGDLPAEVRDRNWISFEDDDAFEPAIERLLIACDRDLDHARAHTRWGLKALEWDGAGRSRNQLLRGEGIVAIEDWLTSAGADAEPQPTELQRSYALESRRAASRRGRTLAGMSTAVAVLAVVLVVFALISRSDAVTAKTEARSQALAATANDYLDTNPAISLVLATRALRTASTPEALFALQRALDVSPLLGDFVPQDAAFEKCQNEPDTPVQLSFGSARYLDDGTLAVATCDGVVTQLAAGTQAVLRRRAIPGGVGSTALAYDPKRSLLAVGAKNTVRILDAHTLGVQTTFAVHGLPRGLTFSPNGKQLAVVATPDPFGYNTLTTIDLDTRHVEDLVSKPRIGQIAYADGGRQIVATTDTTFTEVMDARSGRVLHRLRLHTSAGLVKSPVVASPDGTRLAIGAVPANGNGRVELWSTRTWKRTGVLTTAHQAYALTLDFSPDSTRVAAAYTDGSGGVWLADSREKLLSFGGQPVVSGLTFSADGARVATIYGGLRIWRTSGPEDFAVPTLRTNPTATYRGDSVVAYTSGTRITAFDASTGAVSASLSVPKTANQLVANDGTTYVIPGPPKGRPGLDVLSLTDQRTLGTLPSLTVSYVWAAAPGGRTWVIAPADASPEHPPEVLTVNSPRRIRLQSPPGIAWLKVTFDFSPDGRMIAGTDYNGSSHVWDAATGRIVQSYDEPGEVVLESELNRSGKQLLVTSRGGLSLWDVGTHRITRKLIASASVVSSTYTHDGSKIISFSADQIVRVWDVASGRVIRQYRLPSQPSSYLTVSPGDSSFAVNDQKGVLRVLDICSTCQNASKLLALAAQRSNITLSPQEQAAVDGA